MPTHTPVTPPSPPGQSTPPAPPVVPVTPSLPLPPNAPLPPKYVGLFLWLSFALSLAIALINAAVPLLWVVFTRK